MGTGGFVWSFEGDVVFELLGTFFSFSLWMLYTYLGIGRIINSVS